MCWLIWLRARGGGTTFDGREEGGTPFSAQRCPSPTSRHKVVMVSLRKVGGPCIPFKNPLRKKGGRSMSLRGSGRPSRIYSFSCFLFVLFCSLFWFVLFCFLFALFCFLFCFVFVSCFVLFLELQRFPSSRIVF